MGIGGALGGAGLLFWHNVDLLHGIGNGGANVGPKRDLVAGL